MAARFYVIKIIPRFLTHIPAEIEGYEPYTGKFEVVMFENADSMWEGYMLKEIRS